MGLGFRGLRALRPYGFRLRASGFRDLWPFGLFQVAEFDHLSRTLDLGFRVLLSSATTNGLTNSILRILKDNPKKELRWRLLVGYC